MQFSSASKLHALISLHDKQFENVSVEPFSNVNIIGDSNDEFSKVNELPFHPSPPLSLKIKS